MALPGYEGPFLLGVDFGTESCRAAIFDLRGNPLGFAGTPYKTNFPRPGQAEQSPTDWWEALKASVSRVLDQTGIPARQIAGISYDATTMTVVALDKEGNALRDAIMWMDVRAIKQSKRGDEAESWAKLYNGGGTMPVTAEWYPFKAAWLKENEPEIYKKAYRIVDAPDWLTFKLTGRWTVNLNTAAVRGYYNRDFGGWPVEFFEQIGCGDVFEKLPEDVLPLGQPVEGLSVKAASDLGLTPGIPVVQGGGDAWHGQIGLGVVNPGSLAVITGSSQVMSGQSKDKIYGKGFMGGYTDAVMEGQYTVEGSLVSSGSVLKWFRDNFARDISDATERVGLNVYEVLDKKCANIAPGSDGLIVNQDFQGNRTPYTDSKARGVIWGLSLSHTADHMYHAIMEGVCYGTAHNLKVMEAGGFNPEKLVYCGGATKSKVWMQMYADVTGKPVTLTKVGDAVVLGSCMLAAVGVGLYESLPDAARYMVHESDVIEPNMERHEQYKFFVDQYMNAWPQMAELTHKTVDHIS
ncbi:FGGY-family carbohydrate kinase [Propionimicrobium lymphophilum]|uniref:FGGY-family pentulose kinase n=1 Tax=Propionimicrobium lymphophilum ACS-093-V-SCH5 TaxID=883161 RepID=S2W1E6_9ACTN|nr:FGGY-family carbohydrate kinase [Propionimicrobium lymphophilum]EPD33603.1 FGGY-family pentulose kinase [Propionimicrobium lymphophilum ACS-093-V-SCH5]MDK7708985.1 FGGY-family carbohydrate kinase [Propionimicrobium lymphophilum]MDK7733067.1 FGGY-family carbohydrate kinase [Propionimicrobium lymphophilum]